MQTAIEHALIVLSWHENLQPDEVPPEYLWEDGEGLEQWWKRIEEKRSDGISTGRGSSSSDDEGDPDPGMAENDYAQALKRS